jgi:NADH-quinone oxidoreductase subunit G
VKTVFPSARISLAAGLTAAQLAKVSVIYLGTHANATSAAAKVVIPTLTVFEKSGTFVNQQFRLQKFAQGRARPAGVADDLTCWPAHRRRRWRHCPVRPPRPLAAIAAEVPALAG